MTPDPYAGSALGRLAATAFRRRRAALLTWLAVLVAAIALGSAAGGTFSADYSTPGSESKAAAQLLEERFDDASEDTLDVVWGADDVRSPAVAARVAPVLEEVGRLPGIGGSPPPSAAEVSADGRVAVLRLPLGGRPDAIPESTGETLREISAARTDDGLTVAFASTWMPGLEEPEQASAEMVGLAVALVVLLITFGTLTAAGLPIVTALFGLGISSTLIGVLAALTDVPDWAPQVGAMIGIGVGIDYALLIVTRYRAARAAGKADDAAVVEAMATSGRSVLVAGGTVVISLAGLFLMGLPYLYGVALAAMLSVLVVLAASLTLLPALLGALGPRIDRLRIPGARSRVTPTAEPDARAGGAGAAARWARGVQRRPVAAAVLATVALLALAIPATGLRFGLPDAGNDPQGSTTRVAYDLLTEGFGEGAAGPLVVVAPTADGTDGATLSALRDDIAAQPGVAAVSAARSGRDGAGALLAVTPATGPQDAATVDLVHALRDGPLARTFLPDVALGGATAAVVDQGEATAARLPLFIGGVVGLSFLLLLVAFRAPLVALKAGLMTLLSIGAAYGVVALVASGGPLGELVGVDTETPVPPFIPVMMFAVLFGLSMDYEVFLLSRIRERVGVHGDTSRAVVEGVAGTARVITAAAAIMVAVFGAFALSPEVFVKLIGIGLASAILLDATVVRMVLVPTVMELLGQRNWWLPRWLDRVLPDVRLEFPEVEADVLVAPERAREPDPVPA